MYVDFYLINNYYNENLPKHLYDPKVLTQLSPLGQGPDKHSSISRTKNC